LRPSSSFAWILILSGCALLAVGTGPLSRRFVFPTFRVPTVAPPADLHTWTLPAKDGVAVHALSLDGPPGAPVFVYFHNNRETMVDGVTLARALGRSGFGVVLPEYRGYGLSGGTAPSEQGLYLDAEAVLEHGEIGVIVAEEIAHEPHVVEEHDGRLSTTISMGGGRALQRRSAPPRQ